MLGLQINGKLRGQLELDADCPKDEIEKAALDSAAAQKYLAGKSVRKVIVVPGKLVNIVAG